MGGGGACVLRDFLGFASFLSLLVKGAVKKLGTKSKRPFSCMHVKAEAALVYCHSKEVDNRFGDFSSYLLRQARPELILLPKSY